MAYAQYGSPVRRHWRVRTTISGETISEAGPAVPGGEGAGPAAPQKLDRYYRAVEDGDLPLSP